MELSTSSDSSISRLPPQLLSLVLARLQPAERLGSMARVSSAWRAAAVMATNSISEVDGRHYGLVPDQLKALSGWLQAYAAAAGLECLTVRGEHLRLVSDQPKPLTLPVQQLASLRALDLDNLTVAVQDQAYTQAAAADLPPELCAITHLRLCKCAVRLSTLPAFTNLQHLSLGSRSNPGSSSSSSSSSIPEVASLVHLTHLQLDGGYAQDTVLGSVGALTRLQELLVEGASYTADGLAALPVSLTKLCVRWERSGPAISVRLTVDTTPAIAALTALRWLEVGGATAGFSAALLRDMSSLQHLAVMWGTPLLAAAAAGVGEQEARGVGLTVLNKLTQLQRLELHQAPRQLAAALTAADSGALTASSQLTCLIIDGGMVKQAQYCHMFQTVRLLPSGQSKTPYLPHLKELRATMGLLATTQDVSALVRRCPKLERLDLSEAMPNEGVFEVYDTYKDGDWCSAGLLGQLKFLTSLTVDVQGHDDTEAFWYSMVHLNNLRELDVMNVDVAHFGAIASLVACRKLTSLMVAFVDDLPHEFEMKTPAGQPPDIWRKLPHKALDVALEHYMKAVGFNWDIHSALRSMSRAAAEHLLLLDGEVEGLRATVARLEGHLQDREGKQQRQETMQEEIIADLQGEVGELKSMVAALAAQVQVLQQQSIRQQG